MNYRIKVLVALLMLTASVTPLPLTAMDNDSDSDTESYASDSDYESDSDEQTQAAIREMNHVVLTSRHPVFDQVRTLMDSISRSIANLWRIILGQPLDAGDTPGESAPDIEKELHTIRRGLERMQQLTAHAQETCDDSLTNIERDMLAKLNANATGVLAADGLAGGGGLATVALIASRTPTAMRNLKETRLFPLAIPAAFAAIKPLLGPVVVCVVGYIVYRKVKEFILYEHVAAEKERTAELKALVERYHKEAAAGSAADKEAMNAAFAQHKKQMDNAVSQLRQHFIQIQQEGDTTNKRVDTLIKKVQDDIARQLTAVTKAQADVNQAQQKENAALAQKIAAQTQELARQQRAIADGDQKLVAFAQTQQSMNRELQKVDTAHAQKLAAQAEEFANDRRVLAEVNQKLVAHKAELDRQRDVTAQHFKEQAANLEKFRTDVSTVGSTNLQLKDQLERLALPRLDKVATDIARLREHTDNELKILEYMKRTVIPYVQHKQNKSGSVAQYLPKLDTPRTPFSPSSTGNVTPSPTSAITSPGAITSPTSATTSTTKHK